MNLLFCKNCILEEHVLLIHVEPVVEVLLKVCKLLTDFVVNQSSNLLRPNIVDRIFDLRIFVVLDKQNLIFEAADWQ